MLMSNLGTVNL